MSSNTPNNKKLETFQVFKESEKAVELATKFKYKYYMIERYIQLFGLNETLELLEANEKFESVGIRLNTLKQTDDLFVGLQKKGYEFDKLDNIPFGYKLKIKPQVSKRRVKPKKKTEPKAVLVENNEEPDFTRDKKQLKNLAWGEPEYKDQTKTQTEEEINFDINEAIKKEKKEHSKMIASLGSTNEYLMGKYYIQGIASMLPPLFLNPRSNDVVVDMCAAPGSKTTELAQLMNNEGQLIALDTNENRIKSLKFNLRRCGVTNTTVLNYDAKKLQELNLRPDKILLDVPCTGEGLIRSDPRRKINRKPEDFAKIMPIQRELLFSALTSVKKGGYVMYSTCSIAPEEDEFIIESVLRKYKKAKVVLINDDYGLPGFTNPFGIELSMDMLKARRYFPHIHDTEGFFLCLIKKDE